MDHLHKDLQDNHYPTWYFQEGKLQQKANKKPNPSTVKFIEGARVIRPYTKVLSEQYRHTLAKYKVRVFFKDTSTIKSLLMHSKDPIQDAQKTYIIYHWKCSANNCTAEYIGERVSDHRNQTTSAIRNHHISTKHPKAELKDLYNNRQREQHLTPSSKRSTSHSCQRSITQQKHQEVRIPSVFNKLLKSPRQLELPHSSIPLSRMSPSSLGLSTQKTINTLHLLDLHLQ